MEFIINAKEAMKYGVDEALMINNFRYWIAKNKVNEKHFYDGRYWTYNSHKALSELMPFWSEKQIRRILDSLIKQNVIMKGNYNKMFYDRTSWYAFVDEDLFLDIFSNEKFDLPKKVEYNCPNEMSISDQMGEPIPNKYQINTNKEKEIYKEKESFRKPTIEEIDAYCRERNNSVDAEAFYYHYESKGWLIGKAKMKSWKAAVITWEKGNKNNPAPKKKKSSFFF